MQFSDNATQHHVQRGAQRSRRTQRVMRRERGLEEQTCNSNCQKQMQLLYEVETGKGSGRHTDAL